ncbi:MAG: hypothetical protein JSW58_08110 [Candidatus Latescibacterota bacterium]|nr:MAG: hypothetical protein JSW58_08110 [Candidatus Latescibacterota bacterium]
MKISRPQIRSALPLGAMLATGFVHVATLENFLVSDSWIFVYPRSLIDTLAFFAKSVIPPEWEALWLRPIPMLVFWFDNIVWPGTAWGPHLTNVIFHVANVWLIWLVVRFFQSANEKPRHDSSTLLAAAAACLLYGLHPLGVGSVAWVGARFDVMSVTLGLAGLLMWLKWDAGIYDKKGFIGAVILLLLALLSKEQGGIFIVACALVTLVDLAADKSRRRRNLAALIILAVLVGIYLIYRIIVFEGLGGYLGRPRGFGPVSPVYYLVATLFPFLNFPSGWVLRPTLVLSLVTILAFIPMLWPAGETVPTSTRRKHVVALLGLFFLSLAATMSRAPLEFNMILGHAASRYAFIAIVGLSLIVGTQLQRVVRTPLVHRIALGVMIVVAVSFAWRTDAQIRAWKSASMEAENIVDQTVGLVPNPKLNSTLIFLGIPQFNAHWAYIWGAGLEEALRYRYGLRDDLAVVRYTQPHHLRRADPEKDHVFRYGKKKRLLVELDPSGQVKPRR